MRTGSGSKKMPGISSSSTISVVSGGTFSASSAYRSFSSSPDSRRVSVETGTRSSGLSCFAVAAASSISMGSAVTFEASSV